MKLAVVGGIYFDSLFNEYDFTRKQDISEFESKEGMVRCYPLSQYDAFSTTGFNIPFDNPKDINDRIIFSIDEKQNIVEPNGELELRLIKKDNIMYGQKFSEVLVIRTSQEDTVNIDIENKIISQLIAS